MTIISIVLQDRRCREWLSPVSVFKSLPELASLDSGPEYPDKLISGTYQKLESVLIELHTTMEKLMICACSLGPEKHLLTESRVTQGSVNNTYGFASGERGVNKNTVISPGGNITQQSLHSIAQAWCCLSDSVTGLCDRHFLLSQDLNIALVMVYQSISRFRPTRCMCLSTTQSQISVVQYDYSEYAT